jgi:hypothetical protein
MYNRYRGSLTKEEQMNMWIVNWKPEVKDKRELQEAINSLYRSLQLVMNDTINWECCMPPHLIIGD